MFMTQFPVLVQIVLVLLIVAYAVLLFLSRQNPKVIRRAALAILIAGTGLYMYGFALEGFVQGKVTAFFRSLLLTVKMFVYDGELLETEHAQHVPMWLDLYFFVFYAAMVTSTSAIIMLFGKRAMTTLALRMRRDRFSHVFIGLDRRSLVVAKGITDGDVAFVEFPQEGRSKKISVEGVLSGLGDGADEKDHLFYRKRMVVLSAKRPLKAGYSGDNVFASIGLQRLKRLVDEKTAFYILSDNAGRNIDDLMALLGDESLAHNLIHVCVAREGVARYYKTTLKQTRVHFIYPSSMAAVELMKTPSCHPAAVMGGASAGDGAYSRGLNALVIGFGESGQAVTKWLYEFCASVDPDGKPSRASIVVNDERMDRLKGPFIFDNPGLENSPILHYETRGTESSEFWTLLGKRIPTLDYVAISMRDDASNLDLACTVLMYALSRRGGEMSGLKIVVRKKQMLAHERKLVEKMNEKAGSEVIVCYGQTEKVFRTEMIVSRSRSGINSSATSLASRIEKAYGRVRTEIGAAPEGGVSAAGRMDPSKEGSAPMDGKRTPAEEEVSFHKKNHTRMELHQFISRANFVPSMEMICKGAAKELPEWMERGGEIPASFLENLARTEHLRFSRYLSAHGYTYSPTDDDVFMTNHQICPWEELSESDRQYHRDMVRAMLLTRVSTST